jgi:septal ring factor EnvC (AmiA/AmiB activator)
MKSAAFLILALAAMPASAASSAARRRELQRIQQELDQARQEIEGYKKQQETLSKQLHKLESRNVDTRQRLQGLKGRIESAERRRSELRHRMGGVKLASGFWSAALSHELREYAAGAASREEALGARSLWGEALRRAAIQEKSRLLAGLAGVERRTEQAAAETTKEFAALRDSSRAAAAEHERSGKELEQTKAAAQEARERVAAAERRAKELEESAKALTELLAASLRAAKAAPRGTAQTKLDLPRHSLPWPADGEVSKPFGREKNEFGTVVIRQGVLFATAGGSAVAAVRDGKVIYAGAFRSYGKVVIVDHGAGFFSIYGELSEILKKKGEAVRSGETLARCGNSLYLELRRGVEALDPMLWLMRK